MAEISHDELCKMWAQQRKTIIDWQHQLIRAALALRNEVAVKLGAADKTWKSENNEVKRYIEAVEIDENKDNCKLNLGSRIFNEQDIGVFGISITFDHGLSSYPKQAVYMPIGVRALSPQLAEFCDWNSEEQKIRGGAKWIADQTAAADLVINRFKEYVADDLFSASIKHSGFGFIQQS